MEHTYKTDEIVKITVKNKNTGKSNTVNLEFKDDKFGFATKQFTKSQLESGMVVEHLNGYRSIVMGNTLSCSDKSMHLSNFNENLIHTKGENNLDIVKVYQVISKNDEDNELFKIWDLEGMDDLLEIVWEREIFKLGKYVRLKDGNIVKVYYEPIGSNYYYKADRFNINIKEESVVKTGETLCSILEIGDLIYNQSEWFVVIGKPNYTQNKIIVRLLGYNAETILEDEDIEEFKTQDWLFNHAIEVEKI